VLDSLKAAQQIDKFITLVSFGAQEQVMTAIIIINRANGSNTWNTVLASLTAAQQIEKVVQPPAHHLHTDGIAGSCALH
jgi:hypothetical protein